ncbi:tryptophan 2,3-dioxygenase [Actinophytocola oryzae]|uniref:Tryptophan 2,3-dioxygenase n=1 Tax=Actinophytocola oryzae TaxID=502181 RepID=A0A4R7W409_9PSEU|nr:tryptophan 2,3-dioxygenase family protein [Actinophytocola oryzae]TDV57406.1 tryptophan 2,3-dioxygenase [Actinophytocola oryzae]
MIREVPDIGSSSDAERAANAASGGGCPITRFAGQSTPYIDYQSIDVLLSLQHPRSDAPVEMTFYIMGQVKELLFKLLYEQLCQVRGLLDLDRVADALRELRRVRTVVDLLVRAWDVLGTLAPTEFNSFRDYLGHASGVQSYMYRMVECVLGNKDPALVRPYAKVPGVREQVAAALTGPSLYDAAIALLVRRGAPIEAAVLDRDLTRPYRPAPSVERAWVEIYRSSEAAAPDFQLAEALMDLAEGMSRWRAVHLLTVERVIGAKPGTGGSSGIRWLRRVNEHRFFPELWSARCLL